MASLMPMTAINHVLTTIRAKALELREDFGDDGRACALEWSAHQVEIALSDESNRLVSLPEATRLSGYTEEHLSRMVREGKIPDLRPPGSRARILIHLSDLPLKPGSPHLSTADDTDSPAAPKGARSRKWRSVKAGREP